MKAAFLLLGTILLGLVLALGSFPVPTSGDPLPDCYPGNPCTPN